MEKGDVLECARAMCLPVGSKMERLRRNEPYKISQEGKWISADGEPNHGGAGDLLSLFEVLRMRKPL